MSTKEDFFDFVAQTSPWSIAIQVEKAQGTFIYDTSGKKYYDLISGIGVSSLGHNNPLITNSIKKQADLHLHTMVYGEHIHNTQVQLAKFLISKLPNKLNQVYFLSTGTEANEAAIKLSRLKTGRSQIISFYGSYHGSTLGSLSVSGNSEKQKGFEPLIPDVEFIEFNNIQDLEKISSDTAAVILETIQGDAGIRIPTLDFMIELRKKCDETGTLLILDEIQCGLGRTGKFNAFEHFNIIPDILTLGKSLGGGLPLSALISSKEILKSFTIKPLGHITTSGGNPIACASGLAFLKQIHNLLGDIEPKGNLIQHLLTSKKIKEIRRIGLFIGIELSNSEQVEFVVSKCQERGVLLFWFLSTPNSFRICPPFTISQSEIKHSIEIVNSVIEEL